MPTVSVVTPSYNHARFLPERISSILNQTFHDFEWSIVDDCSTDGSQFLLSDMAAKDPRVKLLFHSHNMGMAATTREAIEMSSGKYIYRAESDDVCHPRFLERMVRVLDTNSDAGIAYCRGLHMDERGRLWGGLRQGKEDFVRPGADFFRTLVRGNCIPGPNIVFTRKVHDLAGGFGIGPFLVACDWHFCLRTCLYGDVAYVSEPLGYHRAHESNLGGSLGRTYNLDLFFRETYGVLLDVFESMPEEHSSLRELRQPALRSATLRHAAPLFAQVLLDKKWAIAREILNGVDRYDPGATGGARWAWACVREQALRLAYANVYTPLARWINGQRSMAAHHGRS